MKTYWLTLVGTVCLLGSVVAQRGDQYRTLRVLPADESTQDPTLVAILAELKRTLAGDDEGLVMRLMTPELRKTYGFGRLGQGERADLERSLALGGAFTAEVGSQHGAREFCLPYAYARYPRAIDIPQGLADLVGDGHAWVVVGANVAARRRPSVTAPVITRLTYEVVYGDDLFARDEQNAVTQFGEPRVWHLVHLPDGRSGYVAAEWLWLFSDRHVCLAQRDGTWAMTKFETGVPTR